HSDLNELPLQLHRPLRWHNESNFLGFAFDPMDIFHVILSSLLIIVPCELQLFTHQYIVSITEFDMLKIHSGNEQLNSGKHNMQSIFISGAGQGIGAAIARLFIQQGYKVGLYDINQSQVTSLAAELGSHAKAGLLDVTQPEQWQSALAEFVAWAGQLNILVNNAGILYSGSFEHTELSAHHRTIDINVKGVINGCYAAF